MKVTTIYRRNLEAATSGKRFIINQGGTSSSKTYSILQTIITLCHLRKNLIVSIVAETVPHLKRGAIRDFFHILRTEGLYAEDKHNKSDNSYMIGSNLIEFFSATNAEGMKGARRDILFVNEAYGVGYDTFDQLEVRTKWLVFADFNPVAEFWVHTELLAKSRDQCEYIHSTYRDNPFLPERIVQSILRHRDSPYWWAVYGMGETGRLEGAIFQNWKYGKFDDTLPSLYGLDFGFNDPDAMVRVAIDSRRRIMYWDEKIYVSGNTPDQLRKMLDYHCNRNNLIIADCADARMIAELRRWFNIRPVDKSKWTVAEALRLMQNYQHIITEESVNLSKEMNNYLWSDKRAGIPIDDFNHCFTGETLITTIKGGVKIRDINIGDYVATDSGYNKVIKKHNNGWKQVNKYSIQFDTFFLYLRCTSDHLIKTTQGWKIISELKSGMQIYLNRNLTEKFTNFIPEKDIFHEEQNECTRQYGNILMGKSLQVIQYTIKIKTHGIIESTILKLKKKININQNTGKQDLKIIKNGLINFILRVLSKLKNGIVQSKVLNGTSNTGKIYGTKNRIKNISANIVEKNLNHDILGSSNTAIITVRQVLCESEGSHQVYDLSVEDNHEYFANGILVHNCIDAGRYAFMMSVKRESITGGLWHKP